MKKNSFLRLMALCAIIAVFAACQKPEDNDLDSNNGNNGGTQLTENFDADGSNINVSNANNFQKQTLEELPEGFDSLAYKTHRANNGDGFVQNGGVVNRGGETTDINGVDVQAGPGWLTSDWSSAAVTGYDISVSPAAPVVRSMVTNVSYNNIAKRAWWSAYIDSLSTSTIEIFERAETGLDASWNYIINAFSQDVEQDGNFWHQEFATLGDPSFVVTSNSYPANNATAKFWDLPGMKNSMLVGWHAYEASNFTKPPSAYQDMSSFSCFAFNEALVLGISRDTALGITYVQVPVSGNGNGTQTLGIADYNPGGWTLVQLFIIEGEEIFQIPGGVWVNNAQVTKVAISYRTKWENHVPDGVLPACKD